MSVTTRFAPSPTGPLHLGHAYSAMLAHDMARAADGRFVLRIEDIDRARSRRHWETLIKEDLRWLGLHWTGPVLRQSDRQPAYDAALDQLWRRGLLYPCTCTRRDIAGALSAPQEGAGPVAGPDGPVYPGTCRPPPDSPAPGDAPLPRDTALRLWLDRALCGHDDTAIGRFEETGAGPAGETGKIPVTAGALRAGVGDVVVSRREMATSYHLSVVVDDAAQGITHVVRGSDLFAATQVHVVLQRLLALPTPVYHHHRLIRDEDGRRLAKRDDARAIRLFRADGQDRAAIRAMVGLPAV